MKYVRTILNPWYLPIKESVDILDPNYLIIKKSFNILTILYINDVTAKTNKNRKVNKRLHKIRRNHTKAQTITQNQTNAHKSRTKYRRNLSKHPNILKSHKVLLNNEISPKLTQNITKYYNLTQHNIARSAQTPHEITRKYPKISQKHTKHMRYTKSKSHKSTKRCTKHKISKQNISKSYQVLRNLLKAHNVSQYQPTFYEISTKLLQVTQNHF